MLKFNRIIEVIPLIEAKTKRPATISCGPHYGVGLQFHQLSPLRSVRSCNNGSLVLFTHTMDVNNHTTIAFPINPPHSPKTSSEYSTPVSNSYPRFFIRICCVVTSLQESACRLSCNDPLEFSNAIQHFPTVGDLTTSFHGTVKMSVLFCLRYRPQVTQAHCITYELWAKTRSLGLEIYYKCSGKTTLWKKGEGDYFSRNFVYILRTATTHHMVIILWQISRPKLRVFAPYVLYIYSCYETRTW